MCTEKRVSEDQEDSSGINSYGDSASEDNCVFLHESWFNFPQNLRGRLYQREDSMLIGTTRKKKAVGSDRHL